MSRINGPSTSVADSDAPRSDLFSTQPDFSGFQRRAIRLYGENIGLAFQIVDDLLDYQGDPGRTGKKVGNDLAEGKMTLPLIHTLQQAAAGDRKTLSVY